MKWVKRLILVGILLVVVAVAAVWLWGNYAAKRGIEYGGTSALGVGTTVSSVSIGWLSSSVVIRGLQIAEPEGYGAGSLMSLGTGKVACEVSSLLSDTVVVNEISLDAPEVTIALKPALPPRSNLGDLLSSLKSKEQQPAPEQEAPGKKYKIGLIRVTNAKVHFDLLAGQTLDVSIPTIELKDVSDESGGPVLLGSVFRQVLAGIAVSAYEQAGDQVPGGQLAGLANTLLSGGLFGKSGLEVGGQVLKSAGSVGQGALTLGKGLGAVGKEAGKVGKEVGGLLKGILGKKEEPKKDE